MVKKFKSVSQYSSKRGDYEQFSGFQSCRDNSLADFGQVILICSANLFNKAVCTKTFEHSSCLINSFTDKMFSKSAVSQAADVEFASDYRLEQIEIVSVKKIETAIAAAIVAGGLRDFFDVFLSRAGIVNGGYKIYIAAVCGTHQFGKHIQTVDAFLQRRKLHLACTVAMFHPSVVFEKGNVVDSCFDTQHKAVLVIHFDCCRPHVMLNTCSLYAGAEVVAHLVLVIGVEISSQKGCDIVGLDSVYRRPDQFIINGCEIALPFENNICCIFGLHDAPMIALLEMRDDRTVETSIGIEYSVNAFDLEVIGQFLRFVKIFDVYKTIVEHGRLDTFVGHLNCQFVMTVEIKLEAKRCPCRHSQITQAKLGIDEIEVVMQTFAAVVLEKRFVGILVIPGLIARTWLHCREDMHQAGMRTALNNDILYALFLAKVLFADEVDGKAVLSGNCFSILPYLFSQRQRPLGIVENSDALLFQKQCHSLGIAYTGNGAGQNDTVITGNDPFDFITMSFNEIWHTRSFQNNCIRQLSEKRRAA
jgi:hypothetical protein